MYDGTVAGGTDEFPIAVVQAAPHVGSPDGVKLWMRPLKELGAIPPERLFCVGHCEPQKYSDDQSEAEKGRSHAAIIPDRGSCWRRSNRRPPATPSYSTRAKPIFGIGR